MSYMDSRNAERLINTYADTILRISYMYLRQTHDAEDICQTVILKFLTRDMYFENLQHEKAWVIRTTINACKDHLRTAFWNRHIALDAANEIPAPEPPKSELLDQVMALPKNYRVSIYLHYYEGYPVQDIAAVLGKSENTVSAYLSRGRKKLKALLENDTETEAKGAMCYVQKY